MCEHVEEFGRQEVDAVCKLVQNLCKAMIASQASFSCDCSYILRHACLGQLDDPEHVFLNMRSLAQCSASEENADQ